MKRKLLLFAVIPLLLAACSKKNDNVRSVSNRLIKQIATTYSNGQRYIIDYKYDDQKRLINTGLNGGVNSDIVYNAGGLSEQITFDGYFALMQVSLDNGHIATINYHHKQGPTDESYLSTFYYDSKGRLTRIFNKEIDLDP